MRFVVVLCLTACARTVPAESNTTVAEHRTMSHAPSQPVAAPTHELVVAGGLSAQELIDAAGLATYLEDWELRVAAIDADAMERWFTQPPRTLFLYAELPIEVADPHVTCRMRCQRLQRWNHHVLNEVAVVAWQEGRFRTVLQLGQSNVAAVDQTRETGEWKTHRVRSLPMQAVAWDDAHVSYAEGAELNEVACVPALRSVPCGGEQPLEHRGYCVDRELVVRPWRAPTVPHVGPIAPAYDDPIPDVPEGDCAVRCEPSACEEALRMKLIPWARLYREDAPVLAAFRSQVACRAFASEREEARHPGDPDQGPPD